MSRRPRGDRPPDARASVASVFHPPSRFSVGNCRGDFCEPSAAVLATAPSHASLRQVRFIVDALGVWRTL